MDTRSPDFIEAISRGLQVIRGFGSDQRELTLAELAGLTGLARPTTRRILITLKELGYVRTDGRTFSLTPRVLELGMAYISSSGLWEHSRHHLRELSEETGESCSIAQLDGSDIVYVARVAVAKLVALSVTIGTRFPAVATSLGKVLLAELDSDDLDRVLATPSLSPVRAAWSPSREEIDDELARVRAQGWAVTNQQLAPAIRSVAAPIRDRQGAVIAAANINAHAAETSLDTLTHQYLPLLLRATDAISADIALQQSAPSELIAVRGRGQS